MCFIKVPDDPDILKENIIDSKFPEPRIIQILRIYLPV